ncbi:MAG: putative secreted protein [Clostridiales bacterium]|nr:putative secreted protein [Clostridiales bacterium]
MKKIIGILLSVTLFSLTFTACGTDTGTKPKGYNTDKIKTRIVDGNSGFAFNIFKELNGEDSDKSIFISPISISTALTMTYNGANSTTRLAMEKALGFKDIDNTTVNQSFNNLLKYLDNIDKKVELNIANSIWIRDGENIREDFLSNNRNNFNAEINTLDFSKNSAANTINKWISNATKGKIDKMLEPPIDPMVVMYLINAIYFKGEWSTQFDLKNTYNHAFKTFNGNVQNVSMMSRRGKIEYMKGDDYKAVRLPYGNGKTSMYCLLPNEGVNINTFVENMSLEEWKNIYENITEVDEVVLEIPKFKLEYGIKNLNRSLESLGMREAFSDHADFSGIGEDLFISNVFHKAVIEVNEKGSEAAAVTSVEVKNTSAMEPIAFIADRPFMFIIADDTTGTILFMGKLLNIN